MKFRYAVLLACLASPTFAQAQLSPEDEKAAFTAAGFALQNGRWIGCAEDESESYTPGEIQPAGDLNGDGQPEAVISEGSSFCYGFVGMGFALVSRQVDGNWKRMASGGGIPNFLTTKDVDEWPDMEIGGPGFCFPVMRWNGNEYVLNRHEYEGKRCNPDG